MKTTIDMAREAGAWSQQNKNCDVEYVMSGESLERFADFVRADKRAALMQLFTDPENQPTQFGTVTAEYMRREILAEREACADLCYQLVDNSRETRFANAIRARGQT